MQWSPGARAMAGGALSFSVMSLLVKLAGRGLPSQEIVLARSVIMLALTLAVLRRTRTPARGVRRGLLLLRGLFGFGALSCFYWSLVHLPLADATVVQYTNPAFTALFAAVTLHERLRLRDGAMLLLSLAGIVLITRPALLFGGAERLDPFAVGIAACGAALSGAAYTTVRKLGSTEPTMVIVFWFALVSTLGSLPVPSALSVVPAPIEWLILLGIGLSTYGGQVLFTRGLALEPAGRATAIAYVQIVFAALWSTLFFGERPDAWTAAGALLVVGSTFALSATPKPAAASPQSLPLGRN
jgi:drug/metabolite transporter (DMT)-like permease